MAEQPAMPEPHPASPAAAVSRCVSKYVVKGGEIDLGGPLVPPAFPCSPRQLSGQVVTAEAARQVLLSDYPPPLLAGKRPTLTA